jgi:hypothetical protein
VRIYKYPLTTAAEQIVRLPLGAQPLHLHNQNGVICIWALVDDASECISPVVVSMYGTGFKLPDSPGTYLGTVHLRDGSLVLHGFYKP